MSETVPGLRRMNSVVEDGYIEFFVDPEDGPFDVLDRTDATRDALAERLAVAYHRVGTHGYDHCAHFVYPPALCDECMRAALDDVLGAL